MKDKGDDILFFEELINRAHLSQPVSSKAKEDAVKSEIPVLRGILKEAGQWSLGFGLLFWVSHIFKKTRTAILTNKILSAFAAVSLGLGAYYTAGYFNKLKDENTVIHRQIIDTDASAEIQRQAKTSLYIKNKIELHKITSTSIDGRLLNSINSSIEKELALLKAGRITRQEEKDDKDIKYIISGDAEDLGDSIQFYIKIIDKETSELISINNRLINKKSNIEQECRNISKDLSSHLK